MQNCDVKFQNFQRAITQKKSFHHIIYSLYSISCKKFLASNTYTFRDIAFAMSKISKKGNNSKIIKKKIFFFQNFTKYFSHHPLSADTGFKLLSLILFEIWHLQNFISIFSKGRNFTRGENSKKKKTRVCYFSMRNRYMKFQDDISFRNIIVAKFQGPKF